MFGLDSNKFKSLIVGAAILTQGASAFALTPAENATVASVRTQLTHMGTQNTSSFCYVVEGGTVQGVNADQPVKIASVMKLMTTFWAIEKLGSPTFRFKTKIYYQASNGEMHIEGSRDPFFNRDRFYLLLSDLNKAGITSLNKLTVDQNFKINMDLFEPTFNHAENHTARSLSDVTKADLTEAFNTSNWWSSRSRSYAAIRAENKTPAMLASVSFKVDSTDVISSNPLAGKPGVKVFEIQSAPLKDYLKKMNIISINPVADELFHALGGRESFREFLQASYRMGDEAVDVMSGSGLPLRSPRNDTTMSCSAVVRLIRRLDLDLEQKHGMDLADIMMVAGVDTGQQETFRDASQSLIVKTGTVDGAKNLAGSMQTTEGDVYFGIFMQGRGSNSGGVRTVLNTFMSKYTTSRVRRTNFVFDQLDAPMQLTESSATRVPVRRN